MTGRFTGRRALVTGASRGIGAGVAHRLAAEGADVVVVARTATGRSTLRGSLAETVQRIGVFGTAVGSITADLTDADQRRGIVERAEDLLGGTIDILVNNAAVAIYQPLVDYPLRRRLLTFEANVHAPLDLAQAVLPGMRIAGRGWIVNLTSASARLFPGPPFQLVEPGTALAVYAASKAALNRLTNALGAELLADGIRVNAVQPRAAVLTEGAQHLVGHTIRPDQLETLEEMVEAVTALCDAPADLTGRICVSLDLLDELGLTARGLDGRILSGAGATW
jgi:citronellol/citronellal dehydrogenase